MRGGGGGRGWGMRQQIHTGWRLRSHTTYLLVWKILFIPHHYLLLNQSWTFLICKALAATDSYLPSLFLSRSTFEFSFAPSVWRWYSRWIYWSEMASSTISIVSFRQKQIWNKNTSQSTGCSRAVHVVAPSVFIESSWKHWWLLSDSWWGRPWWETRNEYKNLNTG